MASRNYCDDEQEGNDAVLNGKFEEIQTKSVKETEDKEQRISDAKDKAQLSTTGSLSLTLIVVLKKLIEDVIGGATDPMVYISLVLVICCIAFQIVIAFLSIHIYTLTSSSMDENQVSSSVEMASHSAEYSERIFRSSSDQELNRQAEKEGASKKRKRDRSITSHIFKLFRELDSSESKQPWYVAFCPCLRVRELYIEEQYSLNESGSRIHDILSLEKFKATMEYSEAQVNASKYGAIDETNKHDKVKDDDPERADVLETLDLKWRRLNTLTTQHRLLELQQEVNFRRKHYAKLFAMQQRLTYLTYIVFILNSFVTGFGLTNGDYPSDLTAAVNSTSSG